ncbi:carbohydrate ABC transporter permease [Corynebacterium liangguodongii]|uniref:ABC transporter permease n=1 Tax=Corynebacterium liangguodongii TaxID=2079535 RepID=A0A2S0WF83_9CORY|nr:sugar ABC transporter permease [Corynebacterium liangguodongii]AWB84410.1 ABC transporter permease [Corynebacterium liangguodongii]PWB99900.1 sugar ABC transporter permease [Corynebacterium liangguodongii]
MKFYRRGVRQGHNLWFLAFIAPFAVGLVVFVYAPVIWSAYLSFFEARNTATPTTFVGLGNYRQLLADPLFTRSLLVFVVFSLLIVPLTYVCSLGLALLLDNLPWGRAFFRSVFFMPTAVSYVIAALIWRLAFFNNAPFGLANVVSRSLGGENIAWLDGTTSLYWVAIVSVRLWLQVGFYMILIIAGLNQIPRDTYEAAALDGASGWSMLRYITLPQLRATSVAVLMLLLINAFQAFDEFYNMLGTVDSYPPYARPPLVHLYLISFGGGQQNLGLGGAGTVILAVLIAAFALAQSWLLGREERAARQQLKGSRP